MGTRSLPSRCLSSKWFFLCAALIAMIVLAAPASAQTCLQEEYNQVSVRVELQADFYAGVWAHYENQLKNPDGRNVIQPGDIEAALNAANAIGDDRLQKQAQGTVRPDLFTHGTSAQRVHWFKKGYETGDVSQGDTFNATSLDNG